MSWQHIKWEYVRVSDGGGYIGWVVGQPMYRIFMLASSYYLGFWRRGGVHLSRSGSLAFQDRVWVRLSGNGVEKGQINQLKQAAEEHFASVVAPAILSSIEETKLSYS